MDDTTCLGPAMNRSWTDGQIRSLHDGLQQLKSELNAIRQQTYAAIDAAKTQLRVQALEASLRTYGGTDSHDSVIAGARAYEAYLKGE